MASKSKIMTKNINVAIQDTTVKSQCFLTKPKSLNKRYLIYKILFFVLVLSLDVTVIKIRWSTKTPIVYDTL